MLYASLFVNLVLLALWWATRQEVRANQKRREAYQQFIHFDVDALQAYFESHDIIGIRYYPRWHHKYPCGWSIEFSKERHFSVTEPTLALTLLALDRYVQAQVEVKELKDQLQVNTSPRLDSDPYPLS